MNETSYTQDPCPNPEAGKNCDLESEFDLIDQGSSMEICKEVTKNWYLNKRIWKQTDEETYEHFLGCMPPIGQEADRFFLAEPYTHSAIDDAPVAMAFMIKGGKFFTMLMSLREYGERVPFPIDGEETEDAPADPEFKVIYSYTRAQAIADGVLVDVTERAREAGFTVPVVVTQALNIAIIDIPESERGCQDVEGRLWDVLMIGYFAAKQPNPESETDRDLVVHMKTEGGESRHALLARIHPGDEGEPVLTIGYPEDF